MTRRPANGWRDRRLAALAVRAAVLLVPLAAAVGSAVIVSRLVDRPPGAPQILWWLLLFGTSSVVLAAVDRLARRLLPLAALLRLSLVFPDRVPSRLAIALRASAPDTLARFRTAEPQTPETIVALATALGRHDRLTRGHSERVRALTDVIGEELGLSGEELDLLRWAAFLHDVGKVTIPAEVLNKTETLTDEEWELVRRHPDEGARIAAPLRPWLGEWFRAIAEHHEHWDGGGYPRGLKGEEIGFGARIVAVADAFDVMTALRSYRTPVNPDAARRELVNERGHHFDPAVVRALLNCSLGRLRRALGPLAWVTQVPLVAAAGSHAPRFGGDKIDTSHALPHLHPAASLHPAAQLPAGAHGAAPHDGGGAGHDGLATAVQGPGPNDR